MARSLGLLLRKVFFSEGHLAEKCAGAQCVAMIAGPPPTGAEWKDGWEREAFQTFKS